MRRLLHDPGAWDHAALARARNRFNELAPSWDEERGEYRAAPARDALSRGTPWPQGLCVEIGAGTGLITQLLRKVWTRTIAIDISDAMTRRSRHPWRVIADGGKLPLANCQAAVIAVTGAPFFPSEFARVLSPTGVILCINALGMDAPYYLPSEEIARAMEAARGTRWDGIESHAGWGSWVVLRSQ